MNRMKRSAMHAKGLAWLIAFGSANICGAQAQPATSKPFPASAASVLASHASASAPALAAAVSSPSSDLSPMAAASQRGGELPVQLTNWPAYESTFAIDVVKDKFAEKFDLHVAQQGIVNWAAFGEDVGQALVNEREGNFNALLYSTEIDIDEVQISFDLMKAELGKRFNMLLKYLLLFLRHERDLVESCTADFLHGLRDGAP